jgi:hypothetical protein
MTTSNEDFVCAFVRGSFQNMRGALIPLLNPPFNTIQQPFTINIQLQLEKYSQSNTFDMIVYNDYREEIRRLYNPTEDPPARSLFHFTSSSSTTPPRISHNCE